MSAATELKRAEMPITSRTRTLPALFDETIERNAARVAMKRRRGADLDVVTYENFGRLISHLGAGFIARGLEKGSRVALFAENGPAWCLVYAAVTSAGGAIVPLDTQLKENELRHLLIHAEARFLAVSRSLLGGVAGETAPVGVQVIALGEGSDEPGALSLDDLRAEGEKIIAGGSRTFAERSAGVEPDDIAAICYTSGTTGQPKGVVLLHRNLVSNVEACRARVPFIETDVFLSLLPLFHTYATTCNFLAPLASGAAIFFGRSLKSRDIRADIEEERVTVICGVPLLFERMAQTMMKKMQERPAHERALFRATAPVFAALARLLRTNVARLIYRKKLAASGLGSIRFCVSGAAALRAEVERTLSSIGIPILQGYGMTEASPVISVNPLEIPRPGTVGPPLSGVEVRIAEPNENGIGEIVVRGPNVMWGYLKNPEATSSVIREGWLHTGDLGTIDSKGYLSFVGRKKSVIVTSGGKNVYPDELEAMLVARACILECIVLPAKDTKGNEQPAAIVVPDFEAISAIPDLAGRITDESVRALVAAEIRRVNADLPEYKRIKEFLVRSEELPKTSTRKVKRHLVIWPED